MQINQQFNVQYLKGKQELILWIAESSAGPIQDQVQLAFQYVLEKINMGMQIKGIYRQELFMKLPNK